MLSSSVYLVRRGFRLPITCTLTNTNLFPSYIHTDQIFLVKHYNKTGVFINQEKFLLTQQTLSPYSLNKNQVKFLQLKHFDVNIPFASFHTFSLVMVENRFCCDYAKRGTAGCKKCKSKIEKGALRLGKVVSNPFSEEGGDMKQWFHPKCLFESFQKARATTKVIEDDDDIEDFKNLTPDDKEFIQSLITDFKSNLSPAKKKSMQQAKLKVTKTTTPSKSEGTPSMSEDNNQASTSSVKSEDRSYTPPLSGEYIKDNTFREFRRICAEVAEEPSYNAKTAIISNFITKGSTGDGFKGDMYLFMKLMIPGVVKRVYNVKDKQLVNLFATIFVTDHAEMIEDLERGDVADTIKIYFDKSKLVIPQKKSLLTIQNVDQMLDSLAGVTKDEDNIRELRKIAKRCTSNDLKMIVRLIKHDLRINAGAKAVLDSLGENAYDAFQASRDLKDVVNRVLQNKKPGGLSKKLSVRASLMTPVLPMLAEACKSVNQAMKKCPNGMYAEIKYDGERVQLHKQGDTFQYFSRTLKPVLPHKVKHFKDFIPKAFPQGSDLILDAEVLLVDLKTGKPMPFGTLGVHKKAAFKDASVCLFVFDCLHYNGENLMDRPIKERRKFLQKNMTEVKNHVMYSEQHLINNPDDLSVLLMRVFREGLEGLVLKDLNSTYNPGKRHWLKVKKDYLAEGAMADSADLVVLGAYIGTGNKGGMMSVFLMGCYNPDRDVWCTVTKCGNGFDDDTLGRLQKELDMVKISKNVSEVPDWLNINKALVPDFVVADPKKAPVWEITGAEFSKAEVHTADGISIRFPRVTKVRDDKDWETATDLSRLKILFKESKEYSKLPDALGGSKSKCRTDTNGGNSSKETEDDSSLTPSSREATPVKRKRKIVYEDSDDNIDDDDDDDRKPSPSKQIKTTGKSPCKYGSSCYQTNPEHMAMYSHSTPRKLHTNSSNSSNELLQDIFNGMKFFIPESTNEYSKLKRYVIAYDGDVVAEHEKSQATHMVLSTEDKGKSIASDVTCVSADWLWKCIRLKKLIPTGK